MAKREVLGKPVVADDRRVKLAKEKGVPVGRITDLGLEFTKPDGQVIIFSTIEGRKRREDRRLELLNRIPKYYNRFGE